MNNPQDNRPGDASYVDFVYRSLWGHAVGFICPNCYIVIFQCTRGEIDGDLVRLYEETDNGTDILTLKKDGDRYLIVAHQQFTN